MLNLLVILIQAGACAVLDDALISLALCSHVIAPVPVNLVTQKDMGDNVWD